METLSKLGVSLLENINDTHKKGIFYVKKSMDNQIFSLKEFKKSGGFLDELVKECKSLGISFKDTLEEKTDISESTSKRYRKLFTDKRVSQLIEDEDESRLRGIKNLGLIKLYKMSMLSDEDFETVVGGDDTPLNKKKVTPPTTDESDSNVDTSDNSDEKGKDTPDIDNDEKITPPSNDDEDNTPSIPEKYLTTSKDEYLTLITYDKVFLVSRVLDVTEEKQILEKEIVELKLQLDTLSPQEEV